MLTVLGDDDLTAKQMWDKLATHCQRQDMWRLVDLFRQLTNTRLLNAASAEQHLATMSDIRTQFINYGKPVPEWIAALLLLLSVPTDDTRWEVFLSSHTAASAATAAASADKDKAPDIKWDTVSAAIMAEASKQAQQDAERTRKQETDQAVAAAYAARMHDGSKQNTDRGTKQPRFCTHCKQKGHVVESCWQKFPKLREEAQARGHVHFVSVHDSNDVALSCRSDAALTGMPGAGVWYIDSGASYSLTGDRTWFTELYNCVPCTVTAANNGTLACTQRGTVVLNVLHGAITVKDVLFVPSLFINLLSVSALLKNGYRPRFTATGCAIVKRRKLLAEAKVHDNVYPLTATRQPAKALSAVVSSSSKGLDWATVHARLGHINPQAIHLMHDKHMVLGVDVPTQGSPDDIKKCAGPVPGASHSPCHTATTAGAQRCVWTDGDNYQAARWQAAGYQVLHSDVYRRLQSAHLDTDHQQQVRLHSDERVHPLQDMGGEVHRLRHQDATHGRWHGVRERRLPNVSATPWASHAS